MNLPDFDAFWEAGYIEIEAPQEDFTFLADFRSDPERHPLRTPSGRIELFSATVHGFGYDDCPGHAVWLAPKEWLGSAAALRFPLHLLSNQPATRLHGQLDDGLLSRKAKVANREPLWLNPADARSRDINEGDVVRVYNDRGACLAGAVITPAVRAGVVQLAAGAWFDPLEPGHSGSLEKHGNPNVLTRDEGTSRLGQGPSALSALVEVERWAGPPADVTAFLSPRVVAAEEAERRIASGPTV